MHYFFFDRIMLVGIPSIQGSINKMHRMHRGKNNNAYKWYFIHNTHNKPWLYYHSWPYITNYFIIIFVLNITNHLKMFLKKGSMLTEEQVFL